MRKCNGKKIQRKEWKFKKLSNCSNIFCVVRKLRFKFEIWIENREEKMPEKILKDFERFHLFEWDKQTQNTKIHKFERNLRYTQNRIKQKL